MANSTYNKTEMNRLQRILRRLTTKRMKIPYKVVFYLLFIFAILLSFLFYFSLLGCDSQAARLIQILTGLAIAATAVIALSNADLPKSKIQSQVKAYIAPNNTGEETYHKKELSDELQEFYRKCSDTFKSYRVQFKITNTSSFNWINPVVTFRLPIKGQVPNRDNRPKTITDPVYTIKKYRSNTFNTQTNVRLLEMIE